MKKLTFRELRTYYNISSKEIADRANVRLLYEYRMELGIPVSAVFAQRVLVAFSLLARRFFELDDVDIALIEDCSTEELATVKVGVHR
jgi:hypothetical protein